MARFVTTAETGNHAPEDNTQPMNSKTAVREKDLILKQLDLLSLAEGFLPSSVLFALVKMQIFELIGEGTKSLEVLAEQTDAPPRALRGS